MCVAGELKLKTCQTRKPKKNTQTSRIPNFQRRWDCCSLRLAKAKSCKVLRAQFSSTGLVTEAKVAAEARVA